LPEHSPVCGASPYECLFNARECSDVLITIMKLISINFVALIFLISNPMAVLADISAVRNFYQFSESPVTPGQPATTQLAKADESRIEVVIKSRAGKRKSLQPGAGRNSC